MDGIEVIPVSHVDPKLLAYSATMSASGGRLSSLGEEKEEEEEEKSSRADNRAAIRRESGGNSDSL